MCIQQNIGLEAVHKQKSEKKQEHRKIKLSQNSIMWKPKQSSENCLIPGKAFTPKEHFVKNIPRYPQYFLCQQIIVMLQRSGLYIGAIYSRHANWL